MKILSQPLYIKKLIVLGNLKNTAFIHLTHVSSRAPDPDLATQDTAVDTASLSGLVGLTFQQGETINNRHDNQACRIGQ